MSESHSLALTPQTDVSVCWVKPERSFEGHGPQSQWDKEQTMCARLTQELTLTRWLTHSVSHCRPPAHTQLHTSARRVGAWAWEKKQLFLCACGLGNFHFGGVPSGKHVTFLFDNYCWRWTVARKPLNPAKYRSAPGYCRYKHLKVTSIQAVLRTHVSHTEQAEQNMSLFYLCRTKM